MTRVALSLDEKVLERAKRHAARRKTSMSKLFVSIICMLDEEDPGVEIPPIIRQLGGLLRPDEGCEVDCERLLDECRMERFGSL